MRGAAMADSRFRVGKIVDFYPSQRGVPASARSYKILHLVPSDGGERLYRIKTIAEAYERRARESELVRIRPA